MILLGLVIGIIIGAAGVLYWGMAESTSMATEDEASEGYEKTGSNMEYPEPPCLNCNHKNTPEGFWLCTDCKEPNWPNWEPAEEYPNGKEQV
jgi:hypothetical protein